MIWERIASAVRDHDSIDSASGRHRDSKSECRQHTANAAAALAFRDEAEQLEEVALPQKRSNAYPPAARRLYFPSAFFMAAMASTRPNSFEMALYFARAVFLICRM